MNLHQALNIDNGADKKLFLTMFYGQYYNHLFDYL